MDELKTAWRDIYANNEENLMILNNGIKYEPSASTSVEMQLNENKRTNSEQIAQIFKLSPNLLSGSCSTAEYMSAVRSAVLPVVEQVQAALNRSLLTEEEKGELYFALDTSELLKGDTLSRYQAYEIALRNGFLQLDEVRYMEDKQPLGFNFMRLGLNDVLYDVKTKTIYTPNMNALTDLSGGLTNGELRDIMELRKKTNRVKGSKGLFTGSVPMGGVKLSKKEYGKIVSEINTNYSKYEGKRICRHNSFWNNAYHTYEFINNGFDNYVFTRKR